MPQALVPPINSGGVDGWWNFTELRVAEDEIVGRFRLNPLNKPRVRIDRTTGDIDLKGSFQLSFRGSCSPVDPQERRF